MRCEECGAVAFRDCTCEPKLSSLPIKIGSSCNCTREQPCLKCSVIPITKSTPLKHALETFTARLAELGYVTDEVTISLPFNALYALWQELSPMSFPGHGPGESKANALEIILSTPSGGIRVRGLG